MLSFATSTKHISHAISSVFGRTVTSLLCLEYSKCNIPSPSFSLRACTVRDQRSAKKSLRLKGCYVLHAARTNGEGGGRRKRELFLAQTFFPPPPPPPSPFVCRVHFLPFAEETGSNAHYARARGQGGKTLLGPPLCPSPILGNFRSHFSTDPPQKSEGGDSFTFSPLYLATADNDLPPLIERARKIAPF